MELKICGEEDVDSALKLLRDQEQEQKANCDNMGDVETSVETEHKVAVISASGDDTARPFECDFGDACGKRFPSRHRLNLHRKQAHGVQPPRAELSCSGRAQILKETAVKSGLTQVIMVVEYRVDIIKNRQDCISFCLLRVRDVQGQDARGPRGSHPE